MCFDKTIFSILFNTTTDVTYSFVRTLVGMMILKEYFLWSDSRYFKQCRFNLFVRSVLGLFNMNNPLPVESTDYLLRQQIYDHQSQTGKDLMGKAFTQIFGEQVSVQSPHDPDSAYRNKDDQKVKCNSLNITETCSEKGLNLITNVLDEKANIPDTSFVGPAIQSTMEVTGQTIEEYFTYGAYQSLANDGCCEKIDMVFTRIQCAESRCDLEMAPKGIMITDTKTGGLIKAVFVKSKETANKIDGEATIFQFRIPLKNGKSKYRDQIIQKMWACCRCLWINHVRIINFTKQIFHRTFKAMEILAIELFSSDYLNLHIRVQPILSRKFSMHCIYRSSSIF